MREISYRQAINEAITQEMKRDENVFIYGIDVADHKRIFGSNNGLVEKFGKERCFSTPLCEDAMAGFGLGAAINGFRPIHVHMRVDFMLLTMNQMANMISSYCYGSNGELHVPMVIRAIVGKGWGQAFQHSKTMYSCFAHIPGLKVIVPSTPRDVKAALIFAIRDDNPVIIFEHRLLYDVQGEVEEDLDCSYITKGRILKEGKDITVVATSIMNVEAVHAADILKRKQGISVEVIDPLCLTPFDDRLVIQSVNKTGRCIVVDNDWVHCGFSAEVSSRINEKCFGKIKKPVKRIGFEFVPCPCTRPLEDLFYPNAVDIIKAIENQLNLPVTDLSNEEFYTYENKFKGPF